MSYVKIAAVLGLIVNLSTVGCIDDGPEGGSDYPTFAEEHPDPSEVEIRTNSFGCGGSDVQIAADNESYEVTFWNAITEREELVVTPINCTVSFEYRFPVGWALEASAGAGGAIVTAENASATVQMRQTLGSEAFASVTKSNDEDPYFIVGLQAGRSGSSHCGATSARMDLVISGAFHGTGSAAATIDSIGGDLVWRRCP